MSQILPDELEFADEQEAPRENPNAPAAFHGALKKRPALETSHAILTRTMWVRRTIEEALAGNTVEVFTKPNGEIALRLDTPLPRDILGYDLAPRDEYSQFELWGMSGKMQCPTWDLTAGPPSVGGSCPASTAGQSICEVKTRKTMLKSAATSAPAGADQQPVKKGQIILTEKMPRKDGAPVPVPFYEGDEDPPNQWRTPVCQYCLTGDARIMVRGLGLVHIASMLDVGEFEVWSGKAWRKTCVKQMGIKPTVTVRTNWGLTLRCTEEHLIKVNPGFIPAGELESGERLDLALPGESPMPEKVAITHTPRAEHNNAVVGHFPDTWSYEVGLFLGYIMGDGSVTAGRYPQVTLCGAEQDQTDLERIRDIVRGWCDTSVELQKHTPAGGALVGYNTQPMATLHWRVLGLSDFLQTLGLDKTQDPKDYRVPTSVFTASRAGVQGFLSGLFSTDGSVVTAGGKVCVVLASVSKKMLEETQLLLASFGIRSSICPYTTSNKWRAEEGYRDLFKLEIAAIDHVRTFRERVGFFNMRKQCRLDELLLNDKREGQPRMPCVTSVEKNDVLEPVYDLFDVGTEHQFVANGLTVHNCYASAGNYRGMNVAVGGIVRYHWTRHLILRDPDLWVRTVVASMKQLDYPLEGKGKDAIMPVRIHSAGDFYSPKYAEAWIKVANELFKWDPRIVMWAPTRSWATPNWAETDKAGQTHWKRLLDPDNLLSARPGSPRLNFVVRASSYHVGDEAAGKLHPTNCVGTSSVFRDDNASYKTGGREKDPRFDIDCPVYNVERDAKTCQWAIDPVTKKMGCRACWRYLDKRVNFTTH